MLPLNLQPTRLLLESLELGVRTGLDRFRVVDECIERRLNVVVECLCGPRAVIRGEETLLS